MWRTSIVVNSESSYRKRFTTIGDKHRRYVYWPLFTFSGILWGSGASVTLAKIHQILLRDFPDVLSRFPYYDDYLILSTWIALFGGLLLFIFPMTISSWICHYLVAKSILYVILATYGITELSPLAFHVVYWAALIIAVVAQVRAMKWYLQHTKIDFLLFALLTLGFIVCPQPNTIYFPLYLLHRM